MLRLALLCMVLVLTQRRRRRRLIQTQSHENNDIGTQLPLRGVSVYADTWHFVVIILELRVWIPWLQTINTIIASSET